MEQNEIQNYVKQLNLQDGDVLFVDAEAVDILALSKNFATHSGTVRVVGLVVPRGKTLNECIEKRSNDSEVTQ